MAALIDSAEIAAFRAEAAALLLVLDEMELREAAALLSMAVDSLDLSANDLRADAFPRVDRVKIPLPPFGWGDGARSQLDPADPDDPFRLTLERLMRNLVNMDAGAVAALPLATPFASWPDSVVIAETLRNRYSEILNLRVPGRERDYPSSSLRYPQLGG